MPVGSTLCSGLRPDHNNQGLTIKGGISRLFSCLLKQFLPFFKYNGLII